MAGKRKGSLEVLVAEAASPQPASPEAAPPAQANPALVARPAPPLGRGGWIWKIVFVVGLVSAIVAIPVLALMGKDAALETTAGKVVGVVTDPEAPGYQVLVEPTPTLMLVQTDGDELASVSFMALSSTETGSALFLPPATAVDGPDGPTTLQDAWDADGMAGLTDAVEQLVGVGIADFADDGALLDTDQVPVVEVDADQLAVLLEPVSPLTVDNPDAIRITDETGAVVTEFAEGEIQLEADQVGEYLAAREPGSNDLNRMARYEAFWNAWMEAVRASSDPGAVAGEQESGLGRFVRTFADGEVGFVPLDASTYNIPGADEAVFLPNDDQLTNLIPQMVPFPRSTEPGDRPTVEVLDGTGTVGASLAVARQLAAGEAEIRAIGNGPSFDYVGTQILYYDPALEDAAEAVQEALGAGTVELRENPDEVVGVTVILGTDVVDELDL